VDGTGSGSFPMVGFGISGAEPSGYGPTSRRIIITQSFRQIASEMHVKGF
jgi:hypothetical protein